MESGDEVVDSVYDWLAHFRFSRPMKNIARDFSDAVLLAEVLAQLLPAWVQLHNYPSAHRFQQKLSNWETLNRKVLTRLKCGVSRQQQEDLANAVPGDIELLLVHVKNATVNSPFLQVKKTTTKLKYETSLFQLCTPTSSPSSSPRTLQFGENHLLDKDATIATSFSELLELVSGTGEDQEKIPKAEGQWFNSKPSLKPKTRATPNYAKPTRSTLAMSRLSSTSPKTGTKPQRPGILQVNSDQNVELNDEEALEDTRSANSLPDLNEFQEEAFVYFSSDREEQAQVARVLQSLPTGECHLQLFRPTQQGSTTTGRSYSATPHLIDCCSSQLHTIQNIEFNPVSNTCEWRESPQAQTPSADIQPTGKEINLRNFYTEVLTRVTLSPVGIKDPVFKLHEAPSSETYVECPQFSPLFLLHTKPMVFPKVHVRIP